MANKLDKALKAYEKAHAWRELFGLALNLKKSRDDVTDMCGRVAGMLHLTVNAIYS
jgi:elongator complex protein 1